MVEVEDSGTPSRKSQHPVKIVVLDENDSESTPRSVHLVVRTFKGQFPGGVVAKVQPNDPDITGDYKCKILHKPPSPEVLRILHGCDLELVDAQATSTRGYSLTVSGHDGKHPAVISTVTVSYCTLS